MAARSAEMVAEKRIFFDGGQVGQAFQPVIRFSDTFGKKKITAWKAVPARRFAAGM